MKTTDLTLTTEEAKEMNGDCSPCGSDDNLPKYPWGTSLYLSDVVLKKMGMNELPAVGSKMMLMAEVTVTGMSKREDQKGVDQTVDMQMTSLGLEPKAEAQPDRSEGRAERMYPTMLTS